MYSKSFNERRFIIHRELFFYFESTFFPTIFSVTKIFSEIVFKICSFRCEENIYLGSGLKCSSLIVMRFFIRRRNLFSRCVAAWNTCSLASSLGRVRACMGGSRFIFIQVSLLKYVKLLPNDKKKSDFCSYLVNQRLSVFSHLLS